ncbi:MFS transporter [Phenylobacterium sp. J367]|uniref:MFS transporter n=1 Tax=Phenylobacterium sp. J367 TaxID=2898435 RepID=UPI0021516B61|nr:MFS transporter [Phenylobacterium sp. J367]MCR5879599.1 MFS transporter [Phenylobacterium sp. J367]
MLAQPDDARERPADRPGGAPAPPAPGAGAWWMVFVLFTFYLMSYVDRTIVAHLVGPLKQSLSLSDFQMGLVLGPAFAVTYSLAMLPAGWIVDRFDRRLVVGGAMIFWSLMTMACGLASSAIGLVAARMLIAVGEALLTPSAYALIGDRFPRRSLASALALYNTGAKAGTSVAFFVAAAAIAAAGVLHAAGTFGGRFEPWQIVFFLVGAPGLVLGLLPLTFGRRARRSPSAPPRPPRRKGRSPSSGAMPGPSRPWCSASPSWRSPTARSRRGCPPSCNAPTAGTRRVTARRSGPWRPSRRCSPSPRACSSTGSTPGACETPRSAT